MRQRMRRRVVNLRREQQRDLVLVVRPQIPAPVAVERVALEGDGVFNHADAAVDEEGAELLGHGVRGVGVVRVQDHDVEAVEEEHHDLLDVAAERGRVVEHVVVLFEEGLAEGFDLVEDRVERDATRLELAPVRPEDAHHFVDFEADPREEHEGEVVRHGEGATGGRGEVFVGDVEGEFGVVFFAADAGVGALGFAGADVEEAELVPDEAADVGFEGC